MNLRILKKLSKRAAPLLESIRVTGKQYPAERWESFIDCGGHERKHWERGNARHPCGFAGYHYFQSRKGLGHPYMHQPDHPWEGTIMVGWEVGYYEREWKEADAWSILKRRIEEHFCEYVPIPGTEDEHGCPEHEWVWDRRFLNPSDVLRALPEVVAKVEKERQERADRERMWELNGAGCPA